MSPSAWEVLLFHGHFQLPQMSIESSYLRRDRQEWPIAAGSPPSDPHGKVSLLARMERAVRLEEEEEEALADTRDIV